MEHKHNHHEEGSAAKDVAKDVAKEAAAPEGAAPKVHPAKGVARTDEMKAKQAESMKARWADPAYRAAVAEGRAKAKAAKAAKAVPTEEAKAAE